MYILLRHAEKMIGPDPGLTSIGRARARALARMFGENTSISIYSTSYNRTRDTAQPLSEATGRPVINYDRSDIVVFADELTKIDGLKCVVGHSKSTLELLEKLTGIEGAPIDEDTEFNRLYIFELPLASSDALIQMRYGDE